MLGRLDCAVGVVCWWVGVGCLRCLGLLVVDLLFCGLWLGQLFDVLLLLFEWWFVGWFVLSCAGGLSMVCASGLLCWLVRLLC